MWETFVDLRRVKHTDKIRTRTHGYSHNSGKGHTHSAPNRPHPGHTHPAQATPTPPLPSPQSPPGSTNPARPEGKREWTSARDRAHEPLYRSAYLCVSIFSPQCGRVLYQHNALPSEPLGIQAVAFTLQVLSNSKSKRSMLRKSVKCINNIKCARVLSPPPTSRPSSAVRAAPSLDGFLGLVLEAILVVTPPPQHHTTQASAAAHSERTPGSGNPNPNLSGVSVFSLRNS
jgi:hypothetical protein